MFGIVLLLSCPLFGAAEEIVPNDQQDSLVPRLLSPKVFEQSPRQIESSRIRTVLRIWETSSNELDERSASSRQSLRLNVTKELNGHAALAIDQLSGRVRAAQLEEQFSWTMTENLDGQVCLEARSKDETEHLFYGSIRVWLDSGRPDTWSGCS